MRINWTGAVTWAIIILPTALAIGARNAESAGAPWEPAEILWLPALVLFAGTIWLSDAAGRKVRHKESGTPVRVADFEASNRAGALGFGALILASSAVAASFEWRVGLALLIVAAGWLLIWIPKAMRRVELRWEIEAACSPQAAFDLVGDPRNWSSYFTELTADTLDGPIHQGSVIKAQLTRKDGRVVQAEERVIEYEPGRRFATAIAGTPREVTGSYDFEPVPGGTRIVYTYRSVLPVATALLGIRLEVGRKVRARRRRGMARMKEILEGHAASPV
jgi:hypothetical protein